MSEFTSIMNLDHGRNDLMSDFINHHNLKFFDKHFMSEFTSIMDLHNGRNDLISDITSIIV